MEDIRIIKTSWTSSTNKTTDRRGVIKIAPLILCKRDIYEKDVDYILHTIMFMQFLQ